jgi:hypothetical protein
MARAPLRAAWRTGTICLGAEDGEIAEEGAAPERSHMVHRVRPLLSAAVAVAAALGLAACGKHSLVLAPSSPASHGAHHRHQRHQHGSAAGGLVVVHDPGRVTGTLTGHCHTRDNGLLPDRSCTPGAIDPAVTQATIGSTICRSGYTDKVRPPESQTEAFKFDVAEPAYGQHHVSGELDHLVPLELGGANDAANLWVEAGRIPNPKDSVENALNEAVCAGHMTLRAAQREIARNWIAAGAALGIKVP